MSNTQEIKQQMSSLIDFVVEANETVRGGEMVNLQGLDEKVAELCDKAVALPPEEAKEVQPVMADMISHLENLGQALKEFQDKQEEQKSE